MEADGYELSFPYRLTRYLAATSEADFALQRPRRHARTWYNFHRDILYVLRYFSLHGDVKSWKDDVDPGFIDFFSPRCIKKLAICLNDYERTHDGEEVRQDILLALRALDELLVVVEHCGESPENTSKFSNHAQHWQFSRVDRQDNLSGWVKESELFTTAHRLWVSGVNKPNNFFPDLERAEQKRFQIV